MAQSLVTVAEKQIVREGDICPIATSLYLDVGNSRPDLVDSQIHTTLMMGTFVEAHIGQEIDRIVHDLAREHNVDPGRIKVEVVPRRSSSRRQD